MVYTFKPFDITENLRVDLENLAKDFFIKLEEIKQKHNIDQIAIMNSYKDGLSFNLFTNSDAVTAYRNNHPF